MNFSRLLRQKNSYEGNKMKYLIFKDKKRRVLFKKTELKFLTFKAFLRENFIKSTIMTFILLDIHD